MSDFEWDDSSEDADLDLEGDEFDLDDIDQFMSTLESNSATAGESVSMRKSRVERVAHDALNWLRGKTRSESPEKKYGMRWLARARASLEKRRVLEKALGKELDRDDDLDGEAEGGDDGLLDGVELDDMDDLDRITGDIDAFIARIESGEVGGEGMKNSMDRRKKAITRLRSKANLIKQQFSAVNLLKAAAATEGEADGRDGEDVGSAGDDGENRTPSGAGNDGGDVKRAGDEPPSTQASQASSSSESSSSTSSSTLARSLPVQRNLLHQSQIPPTQLDDGKKNTITQDTPATIQIVPPPGEENDGTVTPTKSSRNLRVTFSDVDIKSLDVVGTHDESKGQSTAVQDEEQAAHPHANRNAERASTQATPIASAAAADHGLDDDNGGVFEDTSEWDGDDAYDINRNDGLDPSLFPAYSIKEAGRRPPRKFVPASEMYSLPLADREGSSSRPPKAQAVAVRSWITSAITGIDTAWDDAGSAGKKKKQSNKGKPPPPRDPWRGWAAAAEDTARVRTDEKKMNGNKNKDGPEQIADRLRALTRGFVEMSSPSLVSRGGTRSRRGRPASASASASGSVSASSDGDSMPNLPPRVLRAYRGAASSRSSFGVTERNPTRGTGSAFSSSSGSSVPSTAAAAHRPRPPSARPPSARPLSARHPSSSSSSSASSSRPMSASTTARSSSKPSSTITAARASAFADDWFDSVFNTAWGVKACKSRVPGLVRVDWAPGDAAGLQALDLDLRAAMERPPGGFSRASTTSSSPHVHFGSGGNGRLLDNLRRTVPQLELLWSALRLPPGACEAFRTRFSLHGDPRSIGVDAAHAVARELAFLAAYRESTLEILIAAEERDGLIAREGLGGLLGDDTPGQYLLHRWDSDHRQQHRRHPHQNPRIRAISSALAGALAEWEQTFPWKQLFYYRGTHLLRDIALWA